MQEVKENELCVILPASFATGDPGEPLSEPVKEFILQLAGVGYWPVDFGEGNDNAIELWFTKDTISNAMRQSEHFIQVCGDV